MPFRKDNDSISSESEDNSTKYVDDCLQQTDPSLSHTIPELLERNKRMRSEIEVLSDLIRDKCKEIEQIEDSNIDSIVEDFSQLIHVEMDKSAANTKEPLYKKKLRTVLQIIKELEEFTNADGLNDDVIREYINHLEQSYKQILIFKPEIVQFLKSAPKDAIKQFLDSKRATDYEKILFVLKEGSHHSMILFNASNATFYHYDMAAKENSELAEQIIFRLRRYFKVEQLVDVERKSQYAESSLFTIDNMMKIILNAEDSATSNGDLSPLQLINLPSQPDYLKIIIMSRYIVNKLAQIEALVSDSAKKN